MTASWFKIGPISMKIKYVEWRRGTAYYRRRIPSDLQNKYAGKAHLFSSLKTDNPALAAKRSLEETRRIDREWCLLRSNGQSDLQTREEGMAVLRKYGLKPGQAVEYDKYDIEPDEFVDELLAHSHDPYGNNPGIVKGRLPAGLRMAAELFYAKGDELNKLTCPSFSEVIVKHLYFHPRRVSDPQFDRATQRFIEVNGDMPIDQFRREHGNAYVKNLLESGVKKATVKRYLAQVRPVFKTAIFELEVEMNNPLEKLQIPESERDFEQTKYPFTVDQIMAIQKRCMEVSDERRWLIAALSDTGARLSEIAGLLRSDVHLDAQIPYVCIAANSVREVKNNGSARKVPLVGAALWGVKQAMAASKEDYLFPMITRHGDYDKNATSAALNKWLTEQGLRGEKQSLHSLRHSMKDRLRNTGCPKDIHDRIGGWKTYGVGESYGLGHELSVLHNHLLHMIECEKQSAVSSMKLV